MNPDMNPNQIARNNYYRWRERMDREGIRYFREKYRGFILMLLSSGWTGQTGLVRCEYVLPEQNRRFDPVWADDYFKLVPLTDMEVIAHCVACEA